MPYSYIGANDKGQLEASDSVSHRLLASGMNPNSLRTAATLMKDEWIEMDNTVVRVGRERLNGFQDLRNNNLIFNVQNAMGTLVVQHHTASEMTAAEVSMTGESRQNFDRVLFELKSTPLPIIHHDFQINSRVLEASRRLGQTLDTTQVAEATRQVVEKMEDMLFNGVSSEGTLGFGDSSASINGYTDFSNRATVSLAANWDASGTTGNDILDDVLSMIDQAHKQLHFGPFILYIPTNYWVTLMDDFKAESDKTIMQRIQELNGIQDVKPADKLSDDNVVLVEMTQSNVDALLGFMPRVVEWDTQGGMVTNFKVLSIYSPRPKADANNNSGIVHLS